MEELEAEAEREGRDCAFLLSVVLLVCAVTSLNLWRRGLK